MSAFTTQYDEAANLIATIIQANTLTELDTLQSANLKLFNSNAKVQERYCQRREQIRRKLHPHVMIIKTNSI